MINVIYIDVNSESHMRYKYGAIDNISKTYIIKIKRYSPLIKIMNNMDYIVTDSIET